MMAPRKLKDGKDFKMVQRAKICNEEELAHALGDAISSSIPEVVNHPKMNARVAPETSDDQVSCGSLESSLDSSTRSDPEECRRALRKKPRRRSRESRLASNSPRRKSRKVYPSSSSSELFSSDQEELPRKRRDRRRGSNSGRSGVKLQRLSSRQQSRDRRRSRSNKVSHTRKRSPPPRFPDRSNLSRQNQVSTPTEIMAHEVVQAGGSKQTNRHEQSNKQDHASIVDTRFSSQNRIPQSPNTSQNRTHHEHNSAPGTSGTSKQKQSGRAGAGDGRADAGGGRAGAGGGRAGSGDGQAGSGGGRAGAGDGRAGSGDGRADAGGGQAGAGGGRAGSGDGRADAGGGRASAGGGRAGTGGGVNIVESQLSVHVPVVPEDEGTTRTQMQILKEKVAVLQRTIQKLEKAKSDSDDHALELSKKLEAFQGGNEFARIKFTEVEDFAITTADLEQLSDRASSDGMFVGLLLMAILGPERLKKMSATGQASRRFAKKLNADGTPAYPAMEAVEKTLMSFLCDKVAERNQMRLGPSKIASIRAACTEKKIRGYVTRKLSNHKRPAPQKRQQIEQQLADVE